MQIPKFDFNHTSSRIDDLNTQLLTNFFDVAAPSCHILKTEFKVEAAKHQNTLQVSCYGVSQPSSLSSIVTQNLRASC